MNYKKKFWHSSLKNEVKGFCITLGADHPKALCIFVTVWHSTYQEYVALVLLETQVADQVHTKCSRQEDQTELEGNRKLLLRRASMGQPCHPDTGV